MMTTAAENPKRTVTAFIQWLGTSVWAPLRDALTCEEGCLSAEDCGLSTWPYGTDFTIVITNEK